MAIDPFMIIRNWNIEKPHIVDSDVDLNNDTIHIARRMYNPRTGAPAETVQVTATVAGLKSRYLDAKHFLAQVRQFMIDNNATVDWL